MRALLPDDIHPPLARYSHGISVPAGNRLVFVAGQVGIDRAGVTGAGSEEQADLCLANIAAILAEDGMALTDIVRLGVYVMGRNVMDGYRRARDRRFPGAVPTTTLLVVAGLVRPEFLIEIDAVAAQPEYGRGTRQARPVVRFGVRRRVPPPRPPASPRRPWR